MNRPLRDADVETAAAAPPPKVFVRALTTPPAPPWEQARAARLDARLGAPLPLAELVHQVRRLDRWGPGRPGRYGAFYVRAREFREPFETSVEVEGQSVTVRFGAASPDLRRLQGLGSALLALVLCGAILGAGVALALGARREATAQLEADELLAAARLKMAEAFRHRSNQARDLRTLVGHARPLGEVVGDLTWVATSKTPEARVVGVHWERGLLAVEARGEQPPFLAVDRPIERAEKPLRPGVWLWAVGRPQDLASPVRGPVAAELGR
jgi:hypothetical protein